MALITLNNVYLSFSDAPLLDYINLAIEQNERVCLVGRNGAGKSTLLKVIGKELPIDEGQVTYMQDIVVARLQQDPPRDIKGSVYEFVASGLSSISSLLLEYHQLIHQIEHDPSDNNLKRLSELQESIEAQNGWQIDSLIKQVLVELSLDEDAQLLSLSGGWLRKAALAKALVSKPSVLLLDEPTNHLDIETIQWLEQFLKSFNGSIVFISHDRSFIRSLATRIVDLDRGKISTFSGNYGQYLEQKEEMLRVETLQNELFDKRLAQEEVWIRQGIKARRTRNEGRVRALKAMRNEYASRRQQLGTAKVNIEEALRSGKIIFELENVTYQIDNKLLVDDFTVQVLRGDKIALIGPNGIGKTTLIKLMLQQIEPTKGTVHCGTKLELAYFDQHRAELDPEMSVMDNLAYGKQEVTVNGRSRHVLGYLQEFLFPPKRARTPVKALSGGERNRLLLAKLFLNPSNLLILDEPTNDLDVETLELLEELVSDYQGTVLLVSHDRQFVDNSVNQCWFFDGNGKISAFPGGYFDANQQKANSSQFVAKLNESNKVVNKIAEASEKTDKIELKANQTKQVKLSYKEERELQNLPAQLESLENEINALQTQISDPDFFNQARELSDEILKQLAECEKQLESSFVRWETLEAMKQGV